MALIALLSAGVLAGCSGVDAQRAESLLLQSQHAQQRVSAERFVMRLRVDADGMSGEMDLEGGGYRRGPHAGDFYLRTSGEGFPDAGSLDMVLVRRADRISVRANGSTESMSVPVVQARLGSGFADPSEFLDLARYVKSVAVDETDLERRPADRIVGTLDMQRLLGSLGGAESVAFGHAGVHFGDARVVLFVPRDTHLWK